jgi:serine/threonine-protein kinase
MYELLTGRPPFTGDSPVAIAYQHVREDPIPPSRLDPTIPPWADAIILKAMAKPPNERYQTAAEMLADIQRAASGMQVAAMAPLPTRADYYGYADRTQRMGPQTMMGAAPTAAVSPYQQAGYGYDGGYDDGGMEPPRSWARRWLPWLIPLLAVIAAIAVAAVLLTSNNGKNAAVPLVDGQPQAQAVAAISQAGLVPHVVPKADPNTQKGDVINTVPANGNSVPKGSSVTVYVSSGAANALLPNVRGLQQQAAQQKLANAGFNNVTLQSDTQSSLPQGEVDHMTPNPGSQYPPSTQIALYISGGGVQVPEVANLPLNSAIQELTSYGLGYNVDYTQGPTGSSIPPGTVWNQNPQQGTTEPRGYKVTLFVQPQPTSSPTPSGGSSSPTPSGGSSSPTPSGGPSGTGTPTPTGTATPTGTSTSH